MTATTTTARIDPQTQEELMRQAGIWIEHSTLIEDDLPARPLAAVQAEKHQLDRYTQLVADRAAARDSKCLAQIEEPAQPVVGHRISDPSDPTIKPWLSETPDDNGYTSEPLYAGAAPAAVAPRGDYPQLPEGVMCIEQVGGEVIGRPTDYGFKHGRGIVHGAELFTSEQLRAYFDLGRQQPAAAAGPAGWEPDDDSRPRSRADLERVLDEWNDVTGCIPRMSSWRVEVLSIIEDAFDLGMFLGEKAHLAPALEAPAAPATSAQVQALHRARRALHAIGKTYDGSELRTRALEADEEIDRVLAAAPQAPAAPSGRYKLADDGAHQYLDGIEARYSIEREDGTTVAWVLGNEADAKELMAAIGAVPAAPAVDAKVQWWLARLDQYGNPTLTDGAHSDRAGADQAAYLIAAMNLGPGEKYAVARVELTEPRPSADGVNQEAIALHNRAAQAAAKGA